MNNTKVLATQSLYPDVFLHLNIDDSGNIYVLLYAVGRVREVEDCSVIEFIRFDDEYTAMDFLENYSVQQAEAWCKRKKIYYSSSNKNKKPNIKDMQNNNFNPNKPFDQSWLVFLLWVLFIPYIKVAQVLAPKSKKIMVFFITLNIFYWFLIGFAIYNLAYGEL